MTLRTLNNWRLTLVYMLTTMVIIATAVVTYYHQDDLPAPRDFIVLFTIFLATIVNRIATRKIRKTEKAQHGKNSRG